MKNSIDNNIVKEILIYFYENEPKTYISHDQVEINGLDKSTILRYVPLLFEANYLQGYYLDIDALNGRYIIGGLTPIAKEAVRQLKLGKKIDIRNDYL